MTIGILGGGQLGYMLALAGYPLGLRFRFLDPSPEAPVGRIAQRVTADFTDLPAMERFASGLELVTYEFENVPVETARFLAERTPVFPPPAALEAAQDRLNEKHLLERLAIPSSEYVSVENSHELHAAIDKLGFPLVVKTTRLGYDGKGQWTLRTPEDVAHLETDFPQVPLICERFVSFSRELSLIGVRSRDGETAFYPLVENHHRQGILRLSIAPAPSVSAQLQRSAEESAMRIFTALNYVGVLAIEFFDVKGQLLVNELAPRVHNSGHWTIEGAVTSQFENHLRAVLGLPLGATAPTGHSAMVNLIGELPLSADVLSVPDAHLHLYGKTERPGRKLGHVTLRAASPERLSLRLSELPAFFHRPEFCLDAALSRASVHVRNS